MLNVFTLSNGRLVQEEIAALEELAQFQPVWVDLESPTLEEKRWIQQYYGLSIPADAMDLDIEESARFTKKTMASCTFAATFYSMTKTIHAACAWPTY